MKLYHTLHELRDEIIHWKKNNSSIALVPTMGNLHEGHLSLVRLAKQQAQKVIVSIFVNPMQFGPTEDFATYPRTVEADLEKLNKLQVDAVFLPEAAKLFPRPKLDFIKLDLQKYSKELCGITRPDFFSGVMLVVAKLFNITQADIAVFGEKDFQQLTIIKQMVEDLNFSIQIVSAPTVREVDGLAMSSRNSYLTGQQREKAPLLYKMLCTVKEKIQGGETNFNSLEEMAKQSLLARGFEIDYFTIRNQASLLPPKDHENGSLIVLAAVYLGKTRLIDNVQIS